MEVGSRAQAVVNQPMVSSPVRVKMSSPLQLLSENEDADVWDDDEELDFYDVCNKQVIGSKHSDESAIDTCK